MTTTFIWLVKLACLIGSAVSTWYFLLSMFPASLDIIVPIGWACFEVGVLLWPKYTFTQQEQRIFSQRVAGFIMTFVSFAGVSCCFIGNVLILGPDRRLFLISDQIKALVVYVVVGDILLTILVAMLVTSILPYWHLMDRNASIFIDTRHDSSIKIDSAEKKRD